MKSNSCWEVRLLDLKRLYSFLKYLHDYAEVDYHESLEFLREQGLISLQKDKLIISNNWIIYGKQFQSKQDHLLSLLCFKRNYQKYLVEVALLTALKISDSEDVEGIERFVSGLPKLSSYAVFSLKDVQGETEFSKLSLEDRLKKKEEQYQAINRFIFDGPAHYQRVMFYLKHVQAYEQSELAQYKKLGKKIDEQWGKRRMISTDLSLAPLKERPLYTLVPASPERKIDHPQFQHIFTYPWKLFVFLCCIVRENFEAQGVQAIRFQSVGDEVDILLTSSNHKQYRFGSFDEFAIEFCKLNDYELFPNDVDNLQSVFQNLVERKLLKIEDEEYRIQTTVEDVIYHSRVYIPLIAESKQIRGRLERWIDELREKR